MTGIIHTTRQQNAQNNTAYILYVVVKDKTSNFWSPVPTSDASTDERLPQAAAQCDVFELVAL